MIVAAFSATLASAADQTVISEKRYSDSVAVSAETLTCSFTPGNAGSYIPRDTAWANYRLPADHQAVFMHADAGVTVTTVTQESDARAFCQKVQRVIADSRQTAGNVNVQKTLVLSVVRYPNHYSETCQRYLLESLKVAFPHGVTLTSELSRELAALPLSECQR
jgi:hypothetical protein